jgi:hypothetical protein
MLRGDKRLLCGGLLLLVALFGCNGFTPNTTDHRISNYEQSLRAEADWLWKNMVYANTHYLPEASWCQDHDFQHAPVKLSAEQRKQDQSGSYMVDHLDYAATMIGQARGRWDQYCRSNGGANPAPVMESQLRPAYDSLNAVRIILDPRMATPTPYT